jgi:hypothetical protein
MANHTNHMYWFYGVDEEGNSLWEDLGVEGFTPREPNSELELTEEDKVFLKGCKVGGYSLGRRFKGALHAIQPGSECISNAL